MKLYNKLRQIINLALVDKITRAFSLLSVLFVFFIIFILFCSLIYEWLPNSIKYKSSVGSVPVEYALNYDSYKYNVTAGANIYIAYNRNTDNFSVKNRTTDEVHEFDGDYMLFPKDMPSDSLAVFVKDDKRGYFSLNNGKVKLQAVHERAWVFSEKLAAVMNNGRIAFIDTSGKVVLPYNYLYVDEHRHYVFEDGTCIVRDTTGMLGIINTKGEWRIKAQYDEITREDEGVLLTKDGKKSLVAYDYRTVIAENVYDEVSILTINKLHRHDNDTRMEAIPTDFCWYSINGKYGILDKNGNRITEPVYEWIEAINGNLFVCTISGYDKILLNGKGEVVGK